MSAATVIARWLDERTRAVEAIREGYAFEPGPSITPFWALDPGRLNTEAVLLSQLQGAIAAETVVRPPAASRSAVTIPEHITGTATVSELLADASTNLRPITIGGIEFIPSVVHGVPVGFEALTTCCERSPFDLPMVDRMTADLAAVTCQGRP